MNPLELLKEHLQKALNDSTESEDFKEALFDAQYAASLGLPALNTIFQAWCMMPNEEILACAHEIDYFRGCCFVEQQWHQITGMF